MKALLCLVAAAAVACSPAEDPDAPWRPDELALMRSLTPIPPPPPSPGNKVANDERAARLGHALFFDTGLSSNRQVSCATCHQPDKYFTDGLPLAKGVGTAGRNAPTVVGAAWLPYLFHDGRKDSAWSQALGPMEAEVEHGFDRLATAHHLARHYKADYEALFGPLPPLHETARFPSHARPVPFDSRHPHQQAWNAMSAEDRQAVDRVFANFGKVIEAYERKLAPQPAPFDRYVAALTAGDPNGGGHLTQPQRRGLRAFLGKAQCVNCHNGPLLTDKGFHNLGLPPKVGASGIDVGRSQGAQQVKQDPFRCGEEFSDARDTGKLGDCAELRFLNPKFEDFLGAFKTPSLRNVAQTAPYMHGGQFGSLHEVVTFYKTLPAKDAQGRPLPQIGHRELVLTLVDPDVSTDDLVAFLQALTGPPPPGPWIRPPSPKVAKP